MILILATDGMEKSAIAALTAKGCEVETTFYAPDALGAALTDADVVVVRSATKVRAPHIDAAAAKGRLQLIIRGGVGVDNIDVKYAEEKGITVRNTPRASSDAVAELALALMFSVARFVSVAGHSMREDKWEKKAYAGGFELAGKTVGIVGYGRIGQALGRRCQALGMRVLAQDIYQDKSLENENMRYVELDELLAQSDIISLHVPSLPGQPLVCAETLAKMKDGVVLINTSRGSNIDEAALLEALNSGKVYGAGLDVFAEEPSKNAELYKHPRISATPHIGASTGEAQKRIGAEIVDIICAHYGL
ncbi:MAG: D-2-hydroxyacid dehydrogenase [Clostridiales bacterium]|nr:D-2-hydroxyacid dehydrogenase [Clostridiales bacterium]